MGDPDSADPFEGMDDLTWLKMMSDAGVNIPDLLGANPEDDEATRDRQSPPGEGEETLTLTAEERIDLAFDLCDLCDRCEQAEQGRHDQEAEIRDSYDRVFNSSRGGQTTDGSQMVSSMTKSLVDQAAARLTTNILSIDPLIRITSIQGEDADTASSEQMAESAERMLNEYVNRVAKFQYELPRMINRTTKVGESVMKMTWIEEKKTVFRPEGKNGKMVRKSKTVGRLAGELIDNAHVILWPVNLIDWQSGYKVVGHNAFLDKSSWREWAQKFNLSEEDTDSIEGNPGEDNKEAIAEASRHGVQIGNMRDQKLLDPQIMLTELYCDICIPGQKDRTKFHIFLHRPSYKILWIGFNEFYSQKHPYFPLRYELQDAFAHGIGVGHDVLYNQAAQDAMLNLELDNLFAAAYWIIKRKAGSGYNTADQPLRPGLEVFVDDMDDIQPMAMGGAAQGIEESKAANMQDARESSGMASVLSGMGDPVMKSGAGTGSTNALIEQASMKIRLIDQNMRTDLSAMYMFALELIAQYAPDGLFYRYASDDDADKLKLLKWLPPQGEMSEVFHLTAQAPSITSSDDARKQSAITIWGFAMQHVQALSGQVIPWLTATNPSAVPRWQKACADYLSEIGKSVVHYADLPGLTTFMPAMPDPVPEDQQIAALNQQLQQAQQQQMQTQKELQWQTERADRNGLREMINYKDLPPELQASLAQQAGLAGGQPPGGPPQPGQAPPQPGAPQQPASQAPVQPPQPGGNIPQ